MTLLRKGLLAPTIASLFASAAIAKTWHVPSDVSTIQAAIDSCISPDTVLVGPGTYFENIDLLGKTIWVHSLTGPEATILNGSKPNEAVVLFITGESPGCKFEGFTITHGQGHESHGGGIYIYNSSPLIRNNIIKDNQAQSGGGIYVTGESAHPLLDGNTFVENVAASGAGLLMQSAYVVLTNNHFIGNIAGERGGGAYLSLSQPSPSVVSNNEFHANEAKTGGGLFVTGLGTPITISFNLFVENRASGDPIYGAGGGAAFNYLYLSMDNNTFVHNQGATSSSPSGGALALRTLYSGQFARNIISQNSGGGVACIACIYTPCTFSYSYNLAWANSGGDFVGCDTSSDSTLIRADPLFCDPATGNYTLSLSSPAIGLGAFPEPGCGAVPTQRVTWGALKTRAWKTND